MRAPEVRFEPMKKTKILELQDLVLFSDSAEALTASKLHWTDCMIMVLPAVEAAARLTSSKPFMMGVIQIVAFLNATLKPDCWRTLAPLRCILIGYHAF